MLVEIKYIPESHAEHAVSLPSGSAQLHTCGWHVAGVTPLAAEI